MTKGTTMLSELWNSPQQLTITFRALTALILACSIALFFVNQRIDYLRSQEAAHQADRLRAQEHELRSQKGEIDQQTEHISRLTSESDKLRQEALDLQKKAVDAERHVSDIYDFNGAHRQTNGGRTSVSVGAETTVFQNILRLYNEKDWADLIAMCEKQISETPTWLTPYLFAGIGYTNTGRFPAAMERLKFVVDRAGSDPQYSDASRILRELQARQP